MPAAAPTRIASAEFSLSNKVRTFFECVFSETVFFMGCIVDFLSLLVIIKITLDCNMLKYKLQDE